MSKSLSKISAQLFHDILTGTEPITRLHWFKPVATKRWRKIFKEYVSEFGLPESYIEALQKKVQAVRFEEKALTQKAYKVRAEIAWQEAEMLLSKDAEAQPFHITVAIVSKFVGFPINPDKMSAKEFFGYFQLMQNGKQKIKLRPDSRA